MSARRALRVSRTIRPAVVATGAVAAATGSMVWCSSGSGGLLPRIDKIHEVATTDWIKLQTVSYTDQAGRQRKWDMATRTTKVSTAEADAVVILPVLRRANTTLLETLVVEQFRPPMGRSTVELPAGLIDQGELAEEAALRELKQETGYVGTVTHVSMEVCMSPGICDETVKVVVVEVDLDAPENQCPKQELDDGEFCTVRRIPLARMRETLSHGSSMPIEGVYLLALGVEVASRGGS